MARPVFAEISVTAFKSNLDKARELAGGNPLMAVLKANAYGHGWDGLLNRLSPDDLVALTSVEEAVQVRSMGCCNTIVLLEGCFSQEELAWCVRNNIQVVLHSPYQVAFVTQFQQLTDPSGALDVWIKVDTGMHRLGFPADEFSCTYQKVQDIPGIRILGAMTHMACADEPDNPATNDQFALFSELVHAHPEISTISVSNSATLMNFPQIRSDLSRPGILLYGGSCRDGYTGAELALAPVMRLKAQIIAERTIQPGERVGYGFDWEAHQHTRVGVVAVGYADGYPRHAPSGTPVWVAGTTVPLIGRVSMDMITINLTESTATVGDEVELWGEHVSIDQVANLCGTISYELMTGITSRVERRLIAHPG